ncbi:hypothetical protein [uncultured Thioclava sp.]|jgi:hypothetical protein|nr:hypothetical protein [uncultured Thioclava sp.]
MPNRLNRRVLGALGVVSLLGACVPSAGLDDLKRSYPDRQMFQFPSRVAGGELGYLCAPSVTPRATKTRALQAHTAYEAEIRAYGDTFATALIGALTAGAPPKTATRKINGQSDAWARQAALKIEKTYQCLPVSGPGVGVQN